MPLLVFAAIFGSQLADAQIGAGNLQLTIDNITVQNGGGNQTGSNVTPGSTLNGSASVRGVTNSGESASVSCSDSISGQFYSSTFTSDGYGTFSFTPSATGNHSLSCNVQYSGGRVYGSASTAVATVPVEYVSVVDPAYKVVSILYATPGNASSDSFTDTTTNGTTTSIGQSFQAGDTATFSYGWVAGSAGITLGNSLTLGNSSAFTETIANASSLSNASASNGPNTVSHNQDYFLIWLNPEVVLTGDSQNFNYTVHTQSQNGTQE